MEYLRKDELFCNNFCATSNFTCNLNLTSVVEFEMRYESKGDQTLQTKVIKHNHEVHCNSLHRGVTIVMYQSYSYENL